MSRLLTCDWKTCLEHVRAVRESHVRDLNTGVEKSGSGMQIGISCAKTVAVLVVIGCCACARGSRWRWGRSTVLQIVCMRIARNGCP